MRRADAFRQLKNVRNELEAVQYALGSIAATWHHHIARVADEDLHFSIKDVHRLFEKPKRLSQLAPPALVTPGTFF